MAAALFLGTGMVFWALVVFCAGLALGAGGLLVLFVVAHEMPLQVFRRWSRPYEAVLIKNKLSTEVFTNALTLFQIGNKWSVVFVATQRNDRKTFSNAKLFRDDAGL